MIFALADDTAGCREDVLQRLRAIIEIIIVSNAE